VAVLGAGPTGLEAALAAREAGWEVTVHEAAPHAGGHVRAWGHVRMFTPWSMDVSPRAAALVGVPDPDRCPTGAEYAEQHLDPLAARLGDAVRFRSTVLAVGREGLVKSDAIGTADRARRPFRLLLAGPDGREHVETADAVLDCTGSYGRPNSTGDGGIPAVGETALGPRVLREIPDVRARDWAGRDVLLVGAGNSAQTAARDLAAAGARLLWAVRRPEPDWGAVPGDPLPARTALVDSSRRLAGGAVAGVEVVTGVVVEELQRHGDRIAVVLRDRTGHRSRAVVDDVVSLTGSVGDAALHAQLQVHQCYATGGPMALAATLLAAGGGDCLTQVSAGVDALRTTEPRFFVLGAKSYGRTPSFLLRIGWEQVDSVVAALAEEAAVAV
jgi:thioredoxin reductase